MLCLFEGPNAFAHINTALAVRMMQDAASCMGVELNFEVKQIIAHWTRGDGG